MERILKYIDENYHSTITKGEIEDLACCSQRNSQRLFKRFFNETISNCQKRLRLENAYKSLVYTSESIKNIAYDVGYENQSSFNKAFVKHFDITPTEARNTKKVLFDNYIQQNEDDEKRIDYELVHIPLKLVYYKLIMTYNYSNESINRLWNSIENDTANNDSTNYYGLILDQPLISDKANCRYEACIDSQVDSKDYLSKHIFGKKYLKFSHSGDFDSIENTYQQIFYNWIYHLNYEIDNGPIVEHYLIDNDIKNKEGYRTEIYVPVK
ncbi:AraC family transcriptional regulator [Ancylomarina sp. YFZ004]